MSRLVLAIDIGASRLRAALVKNDNGKILLFNRVEKPTPKTRDPSVVEHAIISIAKNALNRYTNAVSGIGVGSIGPLDLAEGKVLRAVNIPAGSFNVATILMEQLGKPVYMANDCMAAAWGEFILAEKEKTLDLVYLTISTGVGAGAVVDGNLLVGKKGNAHEVGHIVVDVSGLMQCGCGGRGHWEAYSGGANIPRFARIFYYEVCMKDFSCRRGAEGSAAARYAEKGELSPPRLYKLAKIGDPYAKRLISEINKYNCAGCESLVNVYDPEVLVIGGSIALNNPEFVVKPLGECLARSRGVITEKPYVRLASYGDDAVLIGAAALAFKPPETLLKRLKYLDSS